MKTGLEKRRERWEKGLAEQVGIKEGRRIRGQVIMGRDAL